VFTLSARQEQDGFGRTKTIKRWDLAFHGVFGEHGYADQHEEGYLRHGSSKLIRARQGMMICSYLVMYINASWVFFVVGIKHRMYILVRELLRYSRFEIKFIHQCPGSAWNILTRHAVNGPDTPGTFFQFATKRIVFLLCSCPFG
jgi:hypothetical protein